MIENKGIRINKYIALCGKYSRRKADQLIADGNVKVNGCTMKTPGYLVQIGDRVEINGTIQKPYTKKLYYLLNKPLGYVTSMSDDKGRPTVAELLADAPGRVFPVGRLDYDTEGLLIMTNDGDFAYEISHPKHETEKVYRVKVEGFLSDNKIAKLRRGIDLGDFITAPAKVLVSRQGKNYTEIEITIHEGKNRQVRRMMEAIGHPVIELTRIAIGNINLGRLKVGHFRKMRPEEVSSLMNKRADI